jgi:uncharacterized hydrophobic protein (TIGR00271 family)
LPQALAEPVDGSAVGLAFVVWPNSRPDRALERLVGSPPCELLVLFNAPWTTEEPDRVLMATNVFAPLSREAVDLSYRLVQPGPDTRVDFLRLVPHTDGEASETIRERLRERISERHPEFTFDVLVRESRVIERGLIEAMNDCGEYDLVIVDAPREGIFRRFARRTVPKRLVAQGVPILLYSAPMGPLTRSILGVWNALYTLVPSTTEEDRLDTYANLRRHSRGNADFHVLLILSATIAALGLLLDSAAVVIGAMIIAPLMQPILGIGLGIATASGRLINRASWTVAKGVVSALLVSAFLAAVIPEAAVTGELNARGQPTLLDLLVALASGAAGAYATGRKGAASSAAGVAIAVALVPPLSTAGVGLSLGDRTLATGALLLFFTNLFAVCAMSATMFLWMGFKPAVGRMGRLASPVLALGTALALVGVVTFFIFARQRAEAERFQERTFAVVEIAVQGVDPIAKLESVSVDSRGDILFVSATVESSFFESLQQALPLIQSDVTRQMDRPTVVRLEDANKPE